MNESEINRIFQERYDRAVKKMRTSHKLYIGLCLAIPIMGVAWFGPYYWIMIILPLLCYPIAYFKHFKRWKRATRVDVLRSATETGSGKVLEVPPAIFGIYQINYRYMANGKKYTAYDMVNKQQYFSVYENLEIPIKFDPNKPNLSYIEI